MESIILYLGICTVGVFVGIQMKKKNITIKYSGRIQTAMLIVLLFTMGCRLGANNDVVNNLSTIGITAAVLTAFILLFSVGSIFLLRKLLGFSKEGER